ncbi:MAG: hypothetical protein ACKPKO_12005, partial [Candidatus Fonsibacter sp.]
FIPKKSDDIKNSDLINTFNKHLSIKFNYFLKILIINLLYLNENVVIRGGFVRDLILKDSKDEIIDIDLYMPENLFNSYINTIYCDSNTGETYNKFHYIINCLSRLILAESLKFKSICLYENITSISEKNV